DSNVIGSLVCIIRAHLPVSSVDPSQFRNMKTENFLLWGPQYYEWGPSRESANTLHGSDQWLCWEPPYRRQIAARKLQTDRTGGQQIAQDNPTRVARPWTSMAGSTLPVRGDDCRNPPPESARARCLGTCHPAATGRCAVRHAVPQDEQAPEA